MKALYVIIPTYDRSLLLRRTLDSLAACTQPQAYRETVVVENGLRAGAEAIVREADPCLRARYMHVEQANKSHALNLALETVGDGLVVFLDDDVRLDPGSLQAYAAAAEAGPGTFFGGPTAVDYEAAPEAWLKAYLPTSALGWSPADPDEMDEESFLGFNWAAFAEDLREVGGFDEGRGPGTISTGQENEMQRRLRDADLQACYVPEALVWHYVPQDRCSPSWIIDRAYRHGVARGMYLKASTRSPRRALRRIARSCAVRLRVSTSCLESAVHAELAKLSPDEHKRFAARYELSMQRGIREGYTRNGSEKAAHG